MDSDNLVAHEGWEKESGWSQAYNGLALFYKGLVANIVILVAAVVIGVMVGLMRSPKILIFTTMAVAIASVAATVVMLIGLGRYRAVPEQTRGRGLAAVAFVLYVLQFLATLLILFAYISALAGHLIMPLLRAETFLTLGVRITSIIALILLLLSMRRVALYVGALGVANSAQTVLIMLLVLLGVALLVVLLALSRSHVLVALGTGGLIVIGLVILVFAIITVAMFLKTVSGLRDAIQAGVVDIENVF